MSIDKRAVLRRVEGRYLLDYALFTGGLREYVVRSLEPPPGTALNPFHLRLFVVVAFREEYSAYEDLGATLNALMMCSADPDVPLLEPLLTYRPGEVKLARVMDRYDVSSPELLYDKAGFGRLIDPSAASCLPDVDLERVLRAASRFFFTDCCTNQKPEGVSAFNKTKHGLLWVPRGVRYAPAEVDGPAALFETLKDDPDLQANPFTVYTIKTDTNGVEQRLRAIHFTQVYLRLLAALRVVRDHRGELAQLGVPSPSALFEARELADVVDIVTRTSEATATPSESPDG